MGPDAVFLTSSQVVVSDVDDAGPWVTLSSKFPKTISGR